MDIGGIQMVKTNDLILKTSPWREDENPTQELSNGVCNFGCEVS